MTAASVQFPNPAVVEVGYTDTDPVTGVDEQLTGRRYAANVAGGPDPLGWSVGWDDGEDIRGVILTEVTDAGDAIVGSDALGNPYRFRDLDPYDAVTLAPGAGVPQPLIAVQAEVLRGGVLAQELDAVVAPDNTVATLMLETGVGTFVRYSGDWQLLTPTSDSLEDMNLIPVSAGALAVWDAADAADQSISIFDLPTTNDDGSINNPEGDVDVETAAAMAASGIQIPEVRAIEDLDLGIRYGNTHPAARWYITKRAHALNASAHIPAHWNVAGGGAVVPPFPAEAAELEM